ncbi:MAG TPA: DUF5615 family PIN-like protein [Devosiaceae bacterium]|nr:DUF5615 family PIN-like protein [Devosiaceae bacterium]
MKVLVEMNMSPKWAETLGASGIETVHWSMIGDSFAKDRDIMAFAAIVLTRDLDFSAILATTGTSGPSVVQLRRGDRFGPNLAQRVIAALRQLERELQDGVVMSVGPSRIRVRRLPLSGRGTQP